MALKNYRLASPSLVIEADDRDPYVSWRNHLARTKGLRGGIDIVAAVGTPIRARTAGRMIQIPNDGSAGNSCRFYHRDNTGWKDVFSHLSSYRTPKNPKGLNAFDYEAGDIVAYSGATVAPGYPAIAPHLHWHLLDPDSVRRNPWDYFSGPALAYVGVTPISTPAALLLPEEDTMADLYFRRQATGTIAIFGADYRDDKHGVVGRHEFESPDEYNAWRNAIVTTNSEIDRLGLDPRGKRYVPPKLPQQVVGLDDLGWGVVCGVYGV